MVISIDSRNKGRILIFDNNAGTSNLLFKYLTDAGYKVLVNHNKEIGTEQSVCSDLILLDIPDEPDHKFDICHYLKYHFSTEEQIPIVLMISQLETRDQINNFRLNQVDYIFKPINQERLIAKIETHLKFKRLQQSLIRQEKESKILFELSENIRQSLNLEVILQKVTVNIQKLLNCDRVVISSYTNNQTSFVTQALGVAISPIIPESYSNFLSKICNSIPTEYQWEQQGNIQVIEDVSNHNGNSTEKQYLAQLGVKAQVMIPIWIQNLNQKQVKLASTFSWLASDDGAPQASLCDLFSKDFGQMPLPSFISSNDFKELTCEPDGELATILEYDPHSPISPFVPPLDNLPYERRSNCLPLLWWDYQTKGAQGHNNFTKLGKVPRKWFDLECLDTDCHRFAITNPDPLPNNSDSRMSSSLWGWLIIHQCNAPKIWSQQELKFLQHLVSQIAVSIRQSLLTENLIQQNQQLQKLALYDPRTQVYNRRYLDRQLSLEWRRLQRIASPLSIIICDIDYFEAYKNFYGQQAGEQCLHYVAKIISQALRRSADFVSLYDEEKFAIILPHTHLQGAQQVAKAIQNTINQLQLPHIKSPISSFVTLSFGIANTIPNIQESSSLIIEAGEQALYIAKSRGRNCFAIYNEEISQLKLQQKQDLNWRKRLHHALEKNLFCLYAQSIKPLDTEDSRQHFEILLRLREQDDTIISPNNFLPIANRYSMMPQIDSWVIENLFTQLTETESKKYQKYVFTINLSGASLNDDIFLDFLQSKISEYHLDPQQFCFEITESVAIDNIPKISTFIKSLKKLGFSFALDDFGTGMSSLTYLKELPVDYVKIDGSFIREINHDSITKSMVIAINNLAQIIGLKTIAEFVEDQAILNTIQELKIDYAQGFYLGKPCLLDHVIF